MAREEENEGVSEEHQPPQRQPDVLQTEREGVVVQASISSWVGPLPAPDVLRAYDDIVPGAANRILIIAEAQSDHRLQMEKTVVAGDSKRAYRGLLAAFVLSAMVIGGGIYLIASGHDWAGVCLIGLNLVGLAAVFVYGSKNLRDDQWRVFDQSHDEP